MATIYDVAKKARVSAATVSHVVNGTRYVSEPIQARVLQAMKELGYRRNNIARSLRRGRTQTLGLLLPDSGNPFFAEIGSAIEEAAYALGYNVILCNTHGSLEREHFYLQLLGEKQVDGIILDTEETHIEGLACGLPDDTPVVMVDRELDETPYDVVLTDNLLGGCMAARHLIELGHRRIACLTGPVNLFSSRHRLEGCRKALEESGLALDGLVVQGDFRPNSGYRGLMELMDQPDPPTAVFASNDMMAIGALRAASELGLRVPGDLSMIGFDDLEITRYTCPTLTTIAQPKDEIGRAAVQRLIEMLEGSSSEGKRTLIPPTLVKRESTGPVNL